MWPRSSSSEGYLFFVSVVYLSMGTLPTKKGKRALEGLGKEPRPGVSCFFPFSPTAESFGVSAHGSGVLR